MSHTQDYGTCHMGVTTRDTSVNGFWLTHLLTCDPPSSRLVWTGQTGQLGWDSSLLLLPIHTCHCETHHMLSFLAILKRFIWSDYNQYFSNTIIWNDNKDIPESASPLSFAELYSQFQLNCSVFAPSHSSHSVVLREQTTCWALKSRQTQLETS